MRWSYPDLLATPDPIIDIILKTMIEEHEERRKQERERERQNAVKRGRR